MKIHLLPALDSNYFFVFEANGKALVIDPGDEAPILEFLKQNHLELEAIWLTHHHWDHTDGVSGVLSQFNVPVYASAKDTHRLEFPTQELHEGDKVSFQGNEFDVLEIPGHTLGQIAFYSEDLNSLFVGDTLFSLGCGRLFEGSPSQMHDSLNRIKKFPPETLIYCGHEYTLKNLEFLKTVKELVPPEDSIEDIEQSIKEKISKTGRSVPTLLSFEMRNNPFLRSDLKTFAEIRAQRDLF